jgi:hypothetical protein
MPAQILFRLLLVCTSIWSANLLAQSAPAPQSTSAEAPPKPAVTITLSDYAPVLARRLDAATAGDDNAKWTAWSAQADPLATLRKTMPEDQLRAKVLATWPIYVENKQRLVDGFALLQMSPVDVMNRVNRMSEFKQNLSLKIVTMGGLGDGTVLSTTDDGTAALYLPLELGASAIGPAMAREYARIIIDQLTRKMGTRSLAEVAIHEGLILRLAREALPESPESAFFAPGELAAFEANRIAILQGIKPHLASSDAGNIERFTTGKGATGLPHEAVYVGWVIAGRWIKNGLRVKEILETPKADNIRNLTRMIEVQVKK